MLKDKIMELARQGKIMFDDEVATASLAMVASSTTSTYFIIQFGSFKSIEVKVRGVCGLVSAVFSQIYYQTNRDRYSHNWNRCTPVKVDFLTYSDAVFCSRFNRFIQFETLK